MEARKNSVVARKWELALPLLLPERRRRRRQEEKNDLWTQCSTPVHLYPLLQLELHQHEPAVCSGAHGMRGIAEPSSGSGYMSESGECNFCGSAEFAPVKNRPEARCVRCGSMERTRLLWMYLQKMEIKPTTRILHLAPERCLFDALSRRASPENYVTSDFDPALYRSFAPNCRHIDLCDMDEWPSDGFDLIIHSHVLEHVPCTLAYPLYHLHRMLTEGGRHVCIIPFMSGCYDETFQEIGKSERVRRFGQGDHVRRIGCDDRHRHLGKLVRLPPMFDASLEFGRAELDRARIPEAQWLGFTIATVLTLAKYDMLLLTPPT